MQSGAFVGSHLSVFASNSSDAASTAGATAPVRRKWTHVASNDARASDGSTGQCPVSNQTRRQPSASRSADAARGGVIASCAAAMTSATLDPDLLEADRASHPDAHLEYSCPSLTVLDEGLTQLAVPDSASSSCEDSSEETRASSFVNASRNLLVTLCVSRALRSHSRPATAAGSPRSRRSACVAYPRRARHAKPLRDQSPQRMSRQTLYLLA
eukprot:6210294-Pleurochrysis_carterae.AAC.2